jgi:hypothetical protein
MFTAKSL